MTFNDFLALILVIVSAIAMTFIVIGLLQSPKNTGRFPQVETKFQMPKGVKPAKEE